MKDKIFVYKQHTALRLTGMVSGQTNFTRPVSRGWEGKFWWEVTHSDSVATKIFDKPIIKTQNYHELCKVKVRVILE